jgi:hypothetical protein
MANRTIPSAMPPRMVKNTPELISENKYIGRGKTTITKARSRMKLMVNQAMIDDDGLNGVLRGKCSLCMDI